MQSLVDPTMCLVNVTPAVHCMKAIFLCLYSVTMMWFPAFWGPGWEGCFLFETPLWT